VCRWAEQGADGTIVILLRLMLIALSTVASTRCTVGLRRHVGDRNASHFAATYRATRRISAESAIVDLVALAHRAQQKELVLYHHCTLTGARDGQRATRCTQRAQTGLRRFHRQMRTQWEFWEKTLSEILKKADDATVVIKAERDGKIRLNASNWDALAVILDGEVLEVRWVRGQLMLLRKVRRPDPVDQHDATEMQRVAR
jgi:hypothetical protein